MSENSEIRFVDISGQTIFTIPDGGYISATRPNGEQLFGHCVYSGENHVEINGKLYSIKEFAELQHYYNATVKPMEKPEIVDGYRVFQKYVVGRLTVFAGIDTQAQTDKRYITWQKTKNRTSNKNPRYFCENYEVVRDLFRRAEDEYQPKAKQRNGRDCR
ncbi:MAG: hypothetical protein LBH95_10155 [Oscillospiraceae bacterium]|nr:hypothetical protein [Oscillospiraceae bacterium]